MKFWMTFVCFTMVVLNVGIGRTEYDVMTIMYDLWVRILNEKEVNY